MAGQFPEVKVDKYHIDILTANFVLHPDWFDGAGTGRTEIRQDIAKQVTGDHHIKPVRVQHKIGRGAEPPEKTPDLRH
jgi:tartrate dehydrogenase/decarboxylase/D-malate dehydrogenase